MGIYTYTFRSKKRQATIAGQKVDLHLMPFAYRGDGIGNTWHMTRQEEALAQSRLERRHDAADVALEKSTSKLAVLCDDFGGDCDNEPVYRISRSSWCDASSRAPGECVGFIKKVGRKITIVQDTGWFDGAYGSIGGKSGVIMYRYTNDNGTFTQQQRLDESRPRPDQINTEREVVLS